MSLHDEHIKMIEAVNNAKNDIQHMAAEQRLTGWRQGVQAAGRNVSLLDADLHYINKGVERPMCCGVFLDWQPTV